MSDSHSPLFVMAVLVTAIHVFATNKNVDGRDSAFGWPGHDG